MLEWLEENKTYLRNVGTGLEQQKGFFESFTSEKDYTLYDTYKDSSAEELRELAKTAEDWETRDWMESRAAALEYKAPRSLEEIDGEMAKLDAEIAELEKKPQSNFEKFVSGKAQVQSPLELKKEARAALETERQAAVSQERAANAPKLPDTVEEIDAELAVVKEQLKLQEEKDLKALEEWSLWASTEGESSPYAKAPANGGVSEETEALQNRKAALEQKRTAILAEDLVGNKYAYVKKDPDFQEKSQYAGMTSVWTQGDYGYINGDKKATDFYEWTVNNGEAVALGRDKLYLSKLRESEKQIYNYLFNTGETGKANEFLEELKPVLLKRQRNDEERYAKWDAQEHPFWSSVATVVTAPLKPLAFVNQTFDGLDGNIDPNAAYNRNLYTSKAIREEVPKNWGPVGSFAYQTGMSMADFLTTTAVAGGNPTIAMTIMGSGAAADTTLEALDRGLSSSQAYSLGVVAGVAEALTERFSLDALLDKTALTKSALGYWLKNVLAEGSEEVSSSLINNFADVMISKDKSQWAQSMQAYKDKGYNDSEAFWKAMGDQAASLGLDFLGGAASGGTLAGLNIAGNAIFKGNTKSQGTATDVQPVEPGTVQTPAGVTDVPQVVAQNPVQTEQNPAVAEQSPVKTEQQVQEKPLRKETAEVVNNREAMQRRLQAAEEAYQAGVISKKELQKIRREAESLDITNTIPETDRVDIQRARAAFEAGEIDEDTYYQIEDAYREQKEQLGTAPAVDEEIQYTENENQELSFAQQQRLAESQKEGVNNANEEFEPTLIGNGGLVGGWIRKSVSDGGSQRDASAGARGEAGQLSGSAAEQTATANPGRAAIQRQNLAKDLRLDKVSSEELVPGRGTEGKKNTILPAEAWDTQMQEVAERVKWETGKEVVYVLGGIEVKTKHGTKTVNGVYDGTQIIIRADHLRLSIEQLADHEMFHVMTDANGGRYQLNAKLRDYILERYDMQTFSAILDKYVEGLRGIVDFRQDMDPEAAEDAMLRIEEEIYADAYAGINAFGAHAEQLQDIVRPWAQENMLPQARQQSNGTRQTNGPNADTRYSFAGRNARTADMEALETAKRMEVSGIDADMIRRETGWFRGKDRKWRFEVDDSSTRVIDQTSNYITLGELLQGAEVIRAYPNIADISVVFQSLEPGVNASYNPQMDSIDVNYRLKGKPEDIRAAVLHEIQHVIQRWEGFSTGTNVRAWDKKIKAGFDSRKASDIREAQEAENRLKKFQEEDPTFYADMMELDAMAPDLPRGAVNWDTLEQIEEDPPEWKAYDARRDKLEEIYGDKMWDFYSALHDLERIRKRPARTAEELYWDTAGEIEARNVAGRRNLTAEQRKKTPPILGGEDTVFADGVGSANSIAETDDGRAVVVVENDILSNLNLGVWNDAVKEQAKAEAKKAMLAFKDGVRVNGIAYKVNQKSRREYTRSQYTETVYRISPNVFADKMRAAGNVGEIITATTDWTRDGGLKHLRKDNFVDFAHGTVLIQAGANQYKADTVVGITKAGEYVFYDIVDMNPTTYNVKKGPPTNTESNEHSSVVQGSPSRTIISGNQNSVKENFSVDDTEPDYRFSVDDMDNLEIDQQEAKEGFTESADGFMTGQIVDKQEAERIAAQEGYPVLDGVQVVPLKTWVRAEDLRFDEHTGLPLEQRKYNNYGLVRGIDREGKLVIEFRNKNEGVRATKAIDSKFLHPVEAQYQPTIEELKSLNEMAPEDVRSLQEEMYREVAEEERREREALEELRRREEAEYAETKEKLASGELKPREGLTTKARNYLQKAERKLLHKIRYALSVPRVAAREHLKGTVEQLSAEFLATGRFTQETVDRLFEDAWNQGVIEDREFYDTYKPVKDFLRTTAVTIREADQKDIADYRDFKRRAWGTLKIVNEGGQSVDSVYSELMDMAPGLFPADISHPADQLQRMYDVAKSITITEQNLRSIGGEFGRQMKLEAREAFEDAMQAVRADLRNVKRSADDLAERKRSEQEKPTYDSVEKVIEAYENMKKARRVAEKAVAQNLLTARDEMLVGRLLRGEILLEDLNPETDNAKGITEVYEAKKAYEALAKPLVEYKKKMKAHQLRMADGFLETAISWKDKKSVLAYSRETMRRNIQDIVSDKALAKEIIEYFFEPVQKAEAQRTRFKDKMRQRVAALKLNQKVQKGNIVSESHAVQLLGEAMDNIQCLENAKGYMKTRDGKTLDEWHAVIRNLWEQNPNLDRAKIQNAVDTFREIYDELFKLMNEVRVRFGYEPVNYRRGYFPHFQAQPDGIMAQFGRALGIDTTVATLPTSINGITHTFKPGIRWFGNTQERLGFDTTYDAVGGFDMYIEGVSDVIFQTENIQNLRALAAQIRYRTTDDGIREQIDKIKVDDRLTEAEKDTKIKEVYEGGRYVLNNFIRELDEYTNLLANKKSKWDRPAEEAFGRTWAYRVYKWANNAVAANMVVGNLTTPLTNLIPITQAMGRTGTLNMLRGMWDSIRNNVNLEQDGIDEMSDFLTSRRGSKLLSKTTFQKVQDAAGAYMEAVDRFTSGAVVRAAYYHNLQQGLTEQEAIHQADLFAASVMADRSKGAMPTIFASQTLKPITAFQLEVNNQISEIFKDMPRYYSDEEKGKLILALLAYFFGAYIFNDVFELIAGRRAAMDPLYIINELAGDVTGYQIPSLYELLSGRASFETEQEKDAGTIVQNFASDVISELPFSGLASVLNSFGILDLEDAGRVPVSSAIPDFVKLLNALSDEEAADEYKWHVAADELSNLMYVIPPFGGSQMLKTGKGIYALIRGGSYTVNKKGEEQLQYPIYTDTAGEAIWNGFRAVVMGKNSTGGALEWVGSKFDTFSAQYTEVYQQMVASGVKQREAFALINELRHIRKTDEETKKFLQRRALQNSSVSDGGKLLAYNGIIASKSEQDLIVALTGVDENSGAILKVLYGMKDAADLKGEEATKAKLQVLDSSGLNAEGQLTAYYDLIGGESEREVIVELDALGAYSANVYEAVRNIREAKLLKGDAETSAKWQAVADADLTDAQKNVLASYIMGSTELETEKGNPTQYAKLLEAQKQGLSWEQYARMKVDGISVDKYLEYRKSGLDSSKAYELLIEMEGLEPMKGKDQIVDVQKWLEVAERPWNETLKDMTLEGMMSESAYEKYRDVADAGVRTYTYVTFLYDTYGWESKKDANGKVTKSLQDQIIDYIAKLDLTAAQKDSLFLTKYSEKNLSKTPWHK